MFWASALGVGAHFLREGQFMRVSRYLVASVLALGCGVLVGAAPALAYTACSSNGDCWHTGSKVQFSGVILSFHDDSWWDAHKGDAQYHWHEPDTDHDWHIGYWNKGTWYRAIY